MAIEIRFFPTFFQGLSSMKKWCMFTRGYFSLILRREKILEEESRYRYLMSNLAHETSRSILSMVKLVGEDLFVDVIVVSVLEVCIPIQIQISRTA